MDRGEDFITIFSKEEDAKKYVENGNKNIAFGYYYEAIEIDEMNNLIEKGECLFEVILDKDGNKLFSRKLKEIPIPIKKNSDVSPFITKASFNSIYLSKKYEGYDKELWNTYYFVHKCNAQNEEDALKQALQAKEKIDKEGYWGTDQFYEKYAIDLLREE